MAVVCALSSTAAICANAATPHSIEYTTISSQKVSVILSTNSKTTLVINPLQCRANSGSDYTNVKSTNSTGNGTSLYAGVVPGSGWKLVSSATYDYTKYKVGSDDYKYSYYWQ